MTSAEVREELVNALQLDLVGPTPEGLGDPAERLDQAPSRWYLTGFLVPTGAGETQANDVDADDEVGETAEPPGATDDDTPRERTAVRERRLPSSMGLSVLLPGEARNLNVRVTWGDYRPETAETGAPEIWRRKARQEDVSLDVSRPVDQAEEEPVPGSDGLFVALLVRPLGAALALQGSQAGLPAGAKTISVFLVNKRRAEDNDQKKYLAFAFQVRLELHADAESHATFLARPDIRGLFSNDWDDEVADLQYRDCGEYSVGHNLSTEACLDEGVCRVARTCWVPRAEVERVEPPASIPDVELGMRAIAGFTDGADAWAKLAALPRAYRSQWIDTQRATLGSITQAKRRATAQALLNNADSAARRIERGIELLRDDAQVLLAFRLANRAMADAAGQRRKNAPRTGSPSSWPSS